MTRNLMRVTVLLVFSLNSVSCVDSTIKGFIGDSVLLPCTYNEPLPEEVNVFWRGSSDSVVLNIIKSSENNTRQHQKYRGRVFSFPDRYKKGNFSINMKNLQKDDSDTYECHIQTVYIPQTVNLIVSDKPEEKTVELDPPSGGAAGLNLLQVLLLPALCLLLCF